MNMRERKYVKFRIDIYNEDGDKISIINKKL